MDGGLVFLDAWSKLLIIMSPPFFTPFAENCPEVSSCRRLQTRGAKSACGREPRLADMSLVRTGPSPATGVVQTLGLFGNLCQASEKTSLELPQVRFFF